MSDIDFGELYARFDAPIAKLNCGDKCAPYNERGVPFCCDTGHAVPTAYQKEWLYLWQNTDLWHPWQGEDPEETRRLKKEAPDGHILIECQGHRRCQRGFRSLTCRAFPFFPYVSSKGEFLGMTYYWEYEDRCWVISNLQVVTPEYRRQFIAAYDFLFEKMPGEREGCLSYSAEMRTEFIEVRRTIPLLHRNGGFYKISPRSERMRRVAAECLPKFGPYKIAAELPFPGEERAE